MPYWSIAQWRARIGSSWCALGRPLKIKSSIKHGARIVKKELTLGRVVTMMILLIMLVGVNIGVCSLVAGGHHHQLMSLFEDFLRVLPQKVYMLKSALLFTLILKSFQRHSVGDGTCSFSFSACFLLYLMFLILKTVNLVMNPIFWLLPAVMIIHLLDLRRVFSVLWILTSEQVEVFDLAIDPKDGLVRMRRDDLRTLCLVNCILDIALSVAASVILSLLLLSGDIEENPGPGDLDYNSVDATQILNEDDFVDVLEAVLPIKSVYFALGRSLRLQPSHLKSIQEVYPNESDAEQALNGTLELWLQKKYNTEKFGLPTWRMLVEAVDRKGGGNNHELAKEIASNHPATMLLTPDNMREIIDLTWPHRARWRLIGIELGIDPGTLDAIDADYKKVDDCLTELITKWLRNTHPRPTRTAITDVLKSERILSAAAHDDKPGTAADDKLNDYADYLKSLYNAKTQTCYQDKDHWPPPVTNKVFRLAMIKAEEIQRRKIDDDFVQNTITGKVDDILRKKVKIELKEIFKGIKDGERRVVLMEGAPGSGKSTLALHMCHQWKDGQFLQDYDQVILVRLREATIQNAQSIADLLPRRLGDETMAHDLEKEMIANDGKGVLFVFDGWDEISKDKPGSTIIKTILNGDRLPKSSVIITSRPVSSVDLHSLVNSRIEILGFTKEELDLYFSGCLEHKKNRVEKLQQRIQENPILAGSCYLPLNASILVHLFKFGDELPKTQFDIFSALICNCIFRHLKKRKEHTISKIQSLDKLPPFVKASFERICTIAYDGVMENKIIFDLEDDFDTLGLLQGVESFAICGTSHSYNFLHLSIQELLAAIHMATRLDDNQQVAQFTKLFGRPRFSAVFTFYSAKTKLKTPGIKGIVIQAVQKCLEDQRATELTSDSDQSHQKSSGFNFGHEPQPLLVCLLHCLYEAQDKELCQLVVTELKHDLDLHFINLNPADCLSVGYILPYCKDFQVNLDECNIGDDGCKTLLRRDGDYSGLLSLDLRSNSISAEGAVTISEPMKTMVNLQTLRLSDNSLGDRGTEAISKALKTMSNLQFLGLCGNSIGTKGATALSEALKSTTTLQTLSLKNNSISDEGAVAISQAMKTMTGLKKLYVYGNFIGEVGQAALSAAAKQTGTLVDMGGQKKEGCGL